MSNTIKSAIKILDKIHNLMNINHGQFTFIFHDGSKSTIKFLSAESELTMSDYKCEIKTFTNDINQTTTYNIYDIKDVN